LSPPSARSQGGILNRTYLVWGATTALYMPFISLVLRDRGFDPAQIGAILAAISLAALMTAAIWSDLADNRLGSRRSLQIAVVLAAAASGLLAVSGERFWIVLIVAASLGGCLIPSFGLLNAVALRHLGPNGLGGFGAIRLWTSLGFAVMAIAVGAVLQMAGVHWALPGFAIALLAYAATTRALPHGLPLEGEPIQRVQSRFGAAGVALHTVPGLRPFLLGLLLVFSASSAAQSFIPLRIATGNAGTFQVGLYGALAACVEIPVMRASVGWTRRYGLPVVYIAGVAAFAVQMLIVSLVTSPGVLTLLAAIRGFGFALSNVAVVQLVGRIVPDHLRNSGQVLLRCTESLGQALGLLIGGIVYAGLGASAFFIAAATMTLTGGGVIWILLATAEGLRCPARLIPEPLSD
jgi:PPP family 3-phenylpropionic acid transporter